MKKAKYLQLLLIPATLFGVCACGGNNSNSSNSVNSTSTDTSTNTSTDTSSDHAYGFETDEGKLRLAQEPTTDMVDTIIDSLISKGGSLIVGGIQTYATSIAINLLKECGFDFRDATTKTLEKIQEQISALETKIDAMAAREEQQHSETVLSPIIQAIDEAQNNYLPFVVTGIGQLAEYENDTTLTEEQIEQYRLDFYNNGVSKLLINGNPLATYVSNLADMVLTPNRTDLSKTIFDYYNNTLGVYDTWATLRIKNMRNFMAYIDTTLVALTNLAKFQMYYMTINFDTVTKNTYAQMVNTMATKVNQVNELFKKQLAALDTLQEKVDNGINIYLATNKEYSTRMATLTFDTTDKVDTDSRQGLLMRINNPGVSYNGYVLEYIPDQSFLASVANDFQTYANAFCTADYTIQDYLKYAGFYATNEELFDKSIGLYNAGMYEDGHGFLNQDYEYTTSYYNNRGEYTRKALYEVDSYHDWNWGVTRTVFTQYTNDYFLCFATPDGDQQKLDGKYDLKYFCDVKKTVEKQVALDVNIYDAISKNNNNGWTLHDCW